ncbi:MAG: hypothetical protein Q8M09_15745 [Pseudomonadota bacterium]|nr:hypothetical protein [Pseudomonadota bacterium]MDP1905675.1 hypothetical protein [Pseudomonadota bacterium]MDP2353345.1 hypothetical protein [Pseudomonadota bacterium]
MNRRTKLKSRPRRDSRFVRLFKIGNLPAEEVSKDHIMQVLGSSGGQPDTKVQATP